MTRFHPRFRLLAAPFQDSNERALDKKHERTARVGTIPGAILFPTHAAAPAKAPVRRFPRGKD